MKRVLICDPPYGWKYGFPKECPHNLIGSDLNKWLVDNGYPQKLIYEGLIKYCRWWEEGEKDNNKLNNLTF